MNWKVNRSIGSAAVLAAIAGGAGTADAAFAPGNIVVTRVQMPGTTTSQAGIVTLLEYEPSGAMVGTYNVPTSGADALTFKLSATTEGVLNQSPDGRWLSIAGYRADVGSTNPGTQPVPRVIGRLDTVTGELNTGTEFIAFTGDSVRSAATLNGTDYYVSGSGTGNDGGLRYVAGGEFGTATTTIGVNNDAPSGNSNNRSAAIIGNQLYVASAGSRPGTGVHKVGSGLPTTDGQTYTNLIPGNAVQSFVFANLSDSVDWDGTGFDTLYVSRGASELVKFSFDGSAWTETSSVTLASILNIAAAVNDGSVTLYATTSVTNTGGLLSLVDDSGYGGTITGQFATLSVPVTAGENAQLRGVQVLVPEPVSLGLLGLTGILLLGRRRARST